MKALALGLGGLGLVVLAAGCQPELAGVKYGEEAVSYTHLTLPTKAFV